MRTTTAPRTPSATSTKRSPGGDGQAQVVPLSGSAAALAGLNAPLSKAVQSVAQSAQLRRRSSLMAARELRVASGLRLGCRLLTAVGRPPPGAFRQPRFGCADAWTRL